MSETVKWGISLAWFIFAVCMHISGNREDGRLGVICSAIFAASI